MTTTQPSTNDLVDVLRQRGQRVTSQRVVILRELRRRGRHATAPEIHEAIHGELPGTSPPTVYATLDLLAELGLVRRIDAGVGMALYDARTEAHQHLACRRCGAVEDLDGDLDAVPLLEAARMAGFAPERAELVISGVCARCAAAAPAPPPPRD